MYLHADVAKLVLDRCFKKDGPRVTFDYEFLEEFDGASAATEEADGHDE